MRIKREQLHSQKIADKAEVIWGETTYAGKQRVKRRSRMLITQCGIYSGIRVLELGCGTGTYTNELIHTRADIVAIDISEPLIMQAVNKLRHYKYVNFVGCQVERLPFKDASFDAVIGNAILHHLELESALKEINRVLTNNGRFAFTEPNMINPQNILVKNIKFLSKIAGESPDETAFVRWNIGRYIKNAGFDDVMVIPFDFLHPICPKVFVKYIDRIGRIIECIPIIKEIAGSLLITGKKKR